MEVNETTIRELNTLSKTEALWYMQHLKTVPRQVRGKGKNQMDITGMVITMDTGEWISVKALLDSGCTGSCINKVFVKKHGLNTVKLPKAIPVFNADGTENALGKLTHTLQLKVVIGGHEEIMNFGVSVTVADHFYNALVRTNRVTV